MTSTLQVGDRVLCYHGPKLYEAKVITDMLIVFHNRSVLILRFFKFKILSKRKSTLSITKDGRASTSVAPCKHRLYLFIFRWDEWVGIERLVDYNDKGLDLQKSLAALHSNVNDQPTELEPSVSLTTQSNSSVCELPTNNKSEVPVMFKLGKNFKFYSSFDWNQIMKKSKILAAPVERSAADFLHSFSKQENSQEMSLFVDNLIKYLDVAIGKGLLYRQERLHYLSLDRNKPLSSLFGPMILVRFFGMIQVSFFSNCLMNCLARLNSVLQAYHSHTDVLNFAAYFSKLSE